MYIPGMSPESKHKKAPAGGTVIGQSRALLHGDKVLQVDLTQHLFQSLQKFANMVGPDAFHHHMKSVDANIVQELGLAPLLSSS